MMEAARTSETWGRVHTTERGKSTRALDQRSRLTSSYYPALAEREQQNTRISPVDTDPQPMREREQRWGRNKKS
jgi:hypothetical protein